MPLTLLLLYFFAETQPDHNCRRTAEQTWTEDCGDDPEELKDEGARDSIHSPVDASSDNLTEDDNDMPWWSWQLDEHSAYFDSETQYSRLPKDHKKYIKKDLNCEDEETDGNEGGTSVHLHLREGFKNKQKKSNWNFPIRGGGSFSNWEQK